MSSKPRQLDTRYGLQVGFDLSAVGSPFVRGKRQPVAAVSVGQYGRGREDLAADPIYGRCLRRLANSFAEADRLSDWIRQRQPGGLVIHLKKEERPERPLRIDVVLGGDTVSRLLVIAEEGSRGTVAVRRRGSGRASSLTELALGRGAQVNLVRVQDLGNSHDFGRLQAELAATARLSVSECLFGGNYTATWTDVILNGSGASFHSRVVVVGTGQERFDLSRQVCHRHPSTETRLESANVLLDGCREIDRGRVSIRRGAAGCLADQKAATLLLGDRAEFASQPELEVDEDDVTCSHASSVGTVDQAKLFYLMSRGLDRSAAERRLAEGFVSPILAEMRRAGLDEMVNCLIAARFPDNQ
jgi:Fe-S cluster assembly protein SufD